MYLTGTEAGVEFIIDFNLFQITYVIFTDPAHFILTNVLEIIQN